MEDPELSRSEIATRLAIIETVLNQMNARLFGNGQPGELSVLKHRVTVLESYLWRGLGGIAIIFSLVQLWLRK